MLTDQQKANWEKEGYLFLKSFFDIKRIQEINDEVDRLWKERSRSNDVIDIYTGTKKEKRIFFSDAPSDAKEKSHKLNDLFLTNEHIRNLILDEQLTVILAKLLNGTPMVCNSLNFQYGSQQRFHFDTFYMPPPTQNKMLATWIALDEVTNENGPLQYYPGSHKIPPYLFSNGKMIAIHEEMVDFDEYIQEQIKCNNLQPVTLSAKPGDVFIWHAQLYHGGAPIKNYEMTRRSIVTHYFTTEDHPENIAIKQNRYGYYMNRPPQPVVSANKYTGIFSKILNKIYPIANCSKSL